MCGIITSSRTYAPTPKFRALPTVSRVRGGGRLSKMCLLIDYCMKWFAADAGQFIDHDRITLTWRISPIIDWPRDIAVIRFTSFTTSLNRRRWPNMKRTGRAGGRAWPVLAALFDVWSYWKLDAKCSYASSYHHAPSSVPLALSSLDTFQVPIHLWTTVETSGPAWSLCRRIGIADPADGVRPGSGLLSPI